MADIVLELLQKERSLKATLKDICCAAEDADLPMDTAEHKQVLRAKFEDLRLGDGWTEQTRGYELERLVLALAAVEGMKPAPSYRPKGEQVDGLLDVDGRYFLVETKWQTPRVSASDIYNFLGKVMSKFEGTCGIFMAMGSSDMQQFAPDATNALVFGKALNILLCDASDMEWAFSPDGSLRRLVRMKLRRASQRGDVYYTWKRFEDEAKLPK